MKRRIQAGLLAFLLMAGMLGGCSSENTGSAGADRSDRDTAAQTREVSDQLEVHFLDIGQGDCTLITCGGEAMLIDAGNNSKGTQVQAYLKSQGIESLDYLVGTHPDADHIGGLDVVLYKFDCEMILMPDEEKETRTYEDVIDAAKVKDETITHPEVGDTYSLGEAEFTVLAPAKNYDNANDSSICIRLQHGDCSFFFAGDAEEESEEDMMNSGLKLKSDVYKVSHHGSKTGTSEEFLEAIDPDYAVISCGEDNSYGHPHAAVLNLLRSAGVEMFRTDEQGTITAVSDGKEITFGLSPSDDWAPGEPTADDTADGQPEKKTDEKSQSKNLASNKKNKQTFILNSNTGKFHLPDCSSVEQMKDENKETVKGTKEGLIKKGYDPCANCLGK